MKTLLKIITCWGILGSFLFVCPHTVSAWTFDVGLSLSSASLQIQSSDDETLGEMVSRTSVWPGISIGSRERYFGDSKFGYSVFFFAWFMEMDKQKVDGQELDLGTSVSGYFAYLTPTISYRFGDRYSMESPNWMMTVGLGLGLGYLYVNGDIIATRLNPPQRQSLHEGGFGLSSGIFAEIIKKRWFLRFTNFGPILDRDTFKLSLQYYSFFLGRRFEL
ncbi:MAG: hypothetical protein D6778_10900 [Nitrospirae bacterium]|nr:MAG: hypothetical protein D6778_10900 [Nitrospirota bacterium]